MRKPKWTKQFRKDYKRLKKSGRYDMDKLQKIIELLIEEKGLPAKHYDHHLLGKWANRRDCHIEGDWILIYELSLNDDGIEIATFHRTGKHSNLFK